MSRRILGLAVTRQTVSAVEVVAVRDVARIERTAELQLTGSPNLSTPGELGKLLREFLRANHFTASRCVIGLEAYHLVAKEKRLPATAAASLDDILRLAAEQNFASDEQELAVDYVPSADPKAPGGLLVAAPRRVVDAIQATAQAAGLAVRGITSSGLALADATTPASSGRTDLLLAVAPGEVAVVLRSQGRPRLLRGLATAAITNVAEREKWLANLEAELRRILATTDVADGGEPTLSVWNGADLDDSSLQAVGSRLAVATHLCRFPQDLTAVEGPNLRPSGNLFAAAALAAMVARGRPLSLDFRHSRLAPRARRIIGRVALAGIVAGVAMLGVGVAMYMDWQSSQQQIQELKVLKDNLEAPAKSAKELIDKTTFARGWFDQRPRVLDCLREVTMAFPQEGQVWVTSLSFTDHLVMSGKAAARDSVVELSDRLRKMRRFSEVKLIYTSQTGTNTQEVTFQIDLILAEAG